MYNTLSCALDPRKPENNFLNNSDYDESAKNWSVESGDINIV